MKKYVIIVIALLLALPIPASALMQKYLREKEGSGVDISGLTYDQLLALQKEVQAALWASPEWKEIRVPAGVYRIGEEIPAGRYAITAEKFGWVYCGAFDRQSGGVDQSAFASYLGELLDDGESVTWTLSAGQYLQLEIPAVFTLPPSFSIN